MASPSCSRSMLTILVVPQVYTVTMQPVMKHHDLPFRMRGLMRPVLSRGKGWLSRGVAWSPNVLSRQGLCLRPRVEISVSRASAGTLSSFAAPGLRLFGNRCHDGREVNFDFGDGFHSALGRLETLAYSADHLEEPVKVEEIQGEIAREIG